MYDYLANARILCHTRDSAELICLGRHKRSDIWSQDSINAEMVRRAEAGQNVVRLKGGDPMIFGRVAEEVRALTSRGIPFEIVPGVTSASAAGAFAGVLLTDRRHASAVALVTGHERLGKPGSSLDYQSLANFPGTLVIYMGVRTAADWSEALLDAGKSSATPVLIVRRGSWPDQTCLETTLGELANELTPYQKIPPPVVVIIGAAARKDPAFDWYSQLPLLGQGIVVTRPISQAEKMVTRFSDLGADAIVQPAISVRPPDDWQPLDDAIQHLSKFDYIVFSSSNGVRHFLDRMLSTGFDLRQLANARLAAIGSQTAATLREYSLVADIQPESFRAEAMADRLAKEAGGKRFLLLRASRGRDVMADQIRQAGGHVKQIVVYQSVDVAELQDAVAEKLNAGEIHWITVTSSAIARSVCRLFANKIGDKTSGIKVASISPITSETLRECGCEPTVEANVYTTDGLIDAVLEFQANGGN